MCDANRNSSKCGGNKDGVPEIMPGWLKCPPSLRERSYPVPDGVDITPISQGGRNGPSKKQFKCGQCGQDARPKPDAKPNAPADCPMMKARNCPGAMDKIEGKGGSILDRIKNFLGIGKEDLRLVEACKHLNVEDEQIRHHRDIFDIPLLCGKDGYFAPLLTKVDCQGQQNGDCTCGTDDVDGEEEDVDDEDCEEYEEEEDYDEEYCEDDEETCEEEVDDSRVENMICVCTCETEGSEGGQGATEEEECVEDSEGECVLEESAECMDPECQFFFEEQDETKRTKEDFSQVGNCPEQDCIAMNNFIIRVQAPFSESTTNETCEQIIERLTKRKPSYPEPEPRSDKPKQDEKGPACKEVELVVRQISVEEPTCECPPKPVKCKEPPAEGLGKVPPPSKVDECEETPPPPPPVDKCEDSPPSPKAEDCPPPDLECECCKSSEETASDDSTAPPSAEPPPVFQNDCEVLSEEELLKKPIKDIKCGCPRSPCESDNRGACWAEGSSVWIPPPPPPCPRCGALERGGTEDCYLCHLTRRMRSGLPEVTEKPKSFVEELPNIIQESTDLCTPEYLPDGSIKYKGGMCMSLARDYIWHLSKRIPPGGFFDRFTGECGEEARLQAVTGAKTYEEAMSSCFSRNDCEQKYVGGMSLENCKRYLWGEPLVDEEEEKAKAKSTCKKPPPTKSSPPPDQCPAPRK